MKPVEMQDVSDYVRASHDSAGWLFQAHVYECVPPYSDANEQRFIGVASVRDPDFLVAATRLICEAKRMREGAR
jgi:hypothetical protein